MENKSSIRILKPPGNDSSDIFNLMPLKNCDLNQDSCSPSESNRKSKNLLASKNLKACMLNSDQKLTPKISALDKENIMSPDNTEVKDYKDMNESESEEEFTKNVDEDLLKEKDKSVGKKFESEKFVCYNPITGKQTNLEFAGERVQLKERSSEMKRPDTSDFGLSRPSIRVRQPPGGISSIFQY